MDFAFTPEQQGLKGGTRRLAEERIAPIAEEADESATVHRGLMAVLAESDLLRYTVPEDYGGFGVRVMNLCIIVRSWPECRRRPIPTSSCRPGQLPHHPGRDARTEGPLSASPGPRRVHRRLRPHRASRRLRRPQHDHRGNPGRRRMGAERPQEVHQPSRRRLDLHRVCQDRPGQGSRSLSAFIVERGTPGFDDSKRLDLMAAHPIGEPVFDDCRIPQGNLIGERGQGLRLALGTLDTFRTTVAAAAIGMGLAAYEAALDYARNRPMFGQQLSDFQATQFKLADMAVSLDAARLLAHRAAWLKDSGRETIIKEASFAKLFATEAASRIVNEAVQIHGGAGSGERQPSRAPLP